MKKIFISLAAILGFMLLSSVSTPKAEAKDYAYVMVCWQCRSGNLDCRRYSNPVSMGYYSAIEILYDMGLINC